MPRQSTPINFVIRFPQPNAIDNILNPINLNPKQLQFSNSPIRISAFPIAPPPAMGSPLSPADRLSGDEIAEENETLVSASSFKGASLNQQQMRRRGNKFAAPPCRQQSFSREISHAAAETYLLTRLSFKLLSYLGYRPFFTFRLCLCFLVLYLFLITFVMNNRLEGKQKVGFWILI